MKSFWMSSGITLIELTLSLFIASMLTILLYQTLNQSRKMVEQSEMKLNVASALPRAYNQLEKDISGIFVPRRFFKEYAEEKAKKEKSSQEKGNMVTGQQDQKQGKIEPLRALFIGNNKESSLDTLTFFTTNSLALFGSTTPYAVRVVYRVVPADNKLFSLERQESPDTTLSLSAYDKSKIPAYTLLNNIKKITAEYYAIDKSKADNVSDKKTMKEIKKNSWSSDERNDKEPLIPACVRISGTIIDEKLRREYDFEWFFEIFAYEGVAERLKLIEDKSNKKESTKNVKEPEKKVSSKPAAPTNIPGKAGVKA